MTHHRAQQRPDSCVAAAMATVFSLCGVEVQEDELSFHAKTSFWSDLNAKQPREGVWGVVPWLGRGNRFDFENLSSRKALQWCMNQDDALMLLEVHA
jgi:hypothetical protein